MSREKRFTPGPWYRDGLTVYALNPEGTNRMSFRIEGGYVEDSRYWYQRTPSDELEATAQVAQQAGDLLEALEGLLREDGAYNAHEAHLTNAEKKALNAIAKAYGEE